MLAAGAGASSEPRGRVIELKRKQTERSNSLMKEKSLLSLSGKCLSMLNLFTVSGSAFFVCISYPWNFQHGVIKLHGQISLH